jgi:hypothetical protein
MCSLSDSAATPDPILEPHFPSRLHQFVWRNWEIVNLDRMALVMRTQPAALREIGKSMGLPAKPQLTPNQLRRIYITVIRQNWHLLPLEQIRELLGWTREKLEFTLKEDDFLDIKLGPKPVCNPVRYADPLPAEKQRAAEIRELIRARMGNELSLPGEPAFAFVGRLSSLESRTRAFAKPRPDQIDFSRYNLVASAPVPEPLVSTVRRHLKSFGATEDVTARLTLQIDPKLSPATFVMQPESRNATLAGGSLDALHQAVRWMQDEMDLAEGPYLPGKRVERRIHFDPRYLYSYFALYGDPLMETEIDPFPDVYLEKLGRAGINGVWMQCVLNNMSPSLFFPEFGKGSEKRLASLNKLVERARRSGLKMYLYLNEPRAMKPGFFDRHPEIKGAESRGLYAMCTTPRVTRDWISDSLAHIFTSVPELGGVFSITMSENLTNCFSKFHSETCPRCSKRSSWDVVGEVLEAVRAGVRRGSQSADVIEWDWGWPDEMCRTLIPRLPRDTRLLSVSEWSIPIERGGVKATVDEYSISVVGPGPRATANWQLAKAAGVPYMAKTQFNNTWEISAVPYVPVANLVARHCANLVKSGIGGIMPSWTLGGYPSPNLQVAKEFYFEPVVSLDEALSRTATRCYGRAARDLALHAWAGFSEAFALYPYGVAVYDIPTQHGPANLLRAKPTGVKCSMILFPQDDYKAWSGRYPPEVVFREFSRMAKRWLGALADFRKAMTLAEADGKEGAAEDLAIAETCWIHFQSTANQVEFYMLRDAPPNDARRARMRDLAVNEIELARQLYPIAKRHSVIAYEASNHYYYRPADLLEKIVNCQYLLDHELANTKCDAGHRIHAECMHTCLALVSPETTL